jgi:hypothetical protein
VALVAAGLTFVGTLLPWVTVAVFSANGTQTDDGKLVLVASLVAAALIATAARPGRRFYLLGGIAGLVCFGTSLYDTIHIFADRTEVFGETIGASPGGGLWLDVIASATLIGAVVKHWRDTRS